MIAIPIPDCLTALVVFNNPVVGKFREVSMDEYDSCLIRGRDVLNFLGDMVNNVVKMGYVGLLGHKILHDGTLVGIRE